MTREQLALQVCEGLEDDELKDILDQGENLQSLLEYIYELEDSGEYLVPIH